MLPGNQKFDVGLCHYNPKLGIPWWSCGWDSLLMPSPLWLGFSLWVGEPTSHKPSGMAKQAIKSNHKLTYVTLPTLCLEALGVLNTQASS